MLYYLLIFNKITLLLKQLFSDIINKELFNPPYHRYRYI